MNPAGGSLPDAAQAPPWRSYALAHAAVVVLVAVVFGASIAWLRPAPDDAGGRWDAFGVSWLDGYARWDGGWYTRIAVHGYSFDEKVQSPIPFFPLYPLAIRCLARLTGPVPADGLCDLRHAVAWGMALNVLAGATAVWLLATWTATRLGPAAGREAAIALSCYPFAFYLVGPVFSEAPFLALALGAFVALDRDRPGLAAVLGMLATATRPIGPAVVVGLFVSALERRGAIARVPGTLRTRWVRDRFAARDLLLLATALGGLAYWLFLFRFERLPDVPGWLVYVKSTSPVGWHKQGWEVWLKLEAWEQLGRWPWQWRGMQAVIAFHLGLTLAAYALLPAVARRCGWGAAAYTFVALALPTWTNKDFVAMGRYVIEAFPCFAVVGAALASHPRWRWPVRGVGLAAMVGFASLFSRWYYVS